MRTRRAARRGIMLTISVMLIGVFAALLTIFAMHSSALYRRHQAERTRVVAQQITDSAVGYARVHLAAWAKTPPSAPIDLDVTALLPRNLTGQASIAVVQEAGLPVCRVTARAAWAGREASRTVDLPLGATTRPG